MTALKRIRAEQEKLANQRLSGEEYDTEHRKWLLLQQEALAILRGERCEEHSIEDCGICKPAGPLRPERG